MLKEKKKLDEIYNCNEFTFDSYR